ncbi:carbohydrate esterase family 4 protein [Piloderma croceum F 1598]|uniref:chitin deacetylase n=1 Tax=Piloderma croceum (strain F 1598) TaxID=765440 RepID=A0A0C3AZ38_PILCF|nr:carbohydrate esterase family 4 protein [Piloderma croceum F 1598]
MHTLPPTKTAAVLFGISLCVFPVRAQASVNPSQPCLPYSDPVVAANLMDFPTPWTIASILPNDAEAMAAWESIAPGVPNISTKGTPDGNFTDFTPTYPSIDPDCWWTYKTCSTPKLPGLPPDIDSIPESRALGFGFDDGPNCSHDAFYDYLLENNQKASMFYIGSNCMDWPDQCRRGVTDGHHISVHTWSHRYMTALPNENAFAELWYARKVIKLITGYTPMYWRPPFGDIDDRIRYIAFHLNMSAIGWSFDSEDWKVASGQATEQDVENNYNSLIQMALNKTFESRGTIMLFHELNNGTMTNAMNFYTKLKDAFIGNLVPVASAENATHPYQETNLSYPNYAQYIQSHPFSGSDNSSTSGGNGGTGGAIGMPAVSGLVGALAVTAMFLDGLARVIT